MDDLLTRIAENMTFRIEGPMKLRLVLQPLMASFFAIRSGLADAKSGQPPYLWAIVTHPSERADLLKDGWKSIGKVFLLALGLDVVFQLIVVKTLYPFETFLVAVMLALVPYVVLRGLTNRLVGRK